MAAELGLEESQAFIAKERRRGKKGRPEDRFIEDVLDKKARKHGALCTHFRNARTLHGWVTPIVGDPGFPDFFALFPDGRLIVVEAKNRGSYPSADQRRWLARWQLVLGAEVYVLRPGDELRWLAILVEGPKPQWMWRPSGRAASTEETL